MSDTAIAQGEFDSAAAEATPEVNEVSKVEKTDEVKNDDNQTEGDVLFGVRKRYGENVLKSFFPYRILMLVFGRWPLTHSENPDGTFTYKMSWKHPNGIYFLVISFYFGFLCLAGGYNFLTIMLYLTKNESSFQENASREKLSLFREGIIVQRNVGLVISILTNLSLVVISTMNVLYKQKYMENYFGFWTRAVQTMHMDVAKGTTVSSWLNIISFGVILFILIIMGLIGFGASTVGAPLLMAIFTFKFFHPNLMTETGMDLDFESNPGVFIFFQILGGIGYIYLFVGAKVFILLYIFKCRLLRNSFASWNGRVYAAVLRAGDFTQTKEGRTTFTLLFKDHCVLLDLLEGTNRFFAGILESYFLLQMAALCFELYVTLRTARSGHNEKLAFQSGFFIRPYDFIPCGLVLLMNSAILYSVTKSAALVGEEAIAGLEVIRRRTMLGRKTDEELYFILSMYTSYISYRKIEMNAGGYFYINKEFVITIVSTIFSYFIILFQFQPLLDPTAVEFPEREEIGKFLVYLENGINCSWLWGNETTTPYCNPSNDVTQLNNVTIMVTTSLTSPNSTT